MAKCGHCNTVNAGKTVTLAGLPYLVRFLTAKELEAECGPDVLGFCNVHAPAEPMLIGILRDLEGLERMDTVIHEMLHGAFPSVKEGVISKLATAIATMLVEDGWERGK